MSNYASSENAEAIRKNIDDYYTYFLYHSPLFLGHEDDILYQDIMALLDKIEAFDFFSLEEKMLADPLWAGIRKIFSFLHGITESDEQVDYEAWRENVSAPLKGMVAGLDAFEEATDFRYTKSQPIRLLMAFTLKTAQLDKETKALEKQEERIAAKEEKPVKREENTAQKNKTVGEVAKREPTL